MKSIQTKPLILQSLFLLIFLSSGLVLLSLQTNNHRKTTSSPPRQPPSDAGELRIRPGFTSYDTYIQRQLNKTLNPRLRRIWTTRDWERKIDVFAKFFAELKRNNLLSNHSKSLCVGARVGQEVAALRRVGVSNSVGIDLVPYPPLVLRGDFHDQPFHNETFDFEFSNVFDHALFPAKFVSEIERTLRPGGVCVLHVVIKSRADKYSANDLYSVRPLVEMFRGSKLVNVRSIDGFGSDTEVVFRKNKQTEKTK